MVNPSAPPYIDARKLTLDPRDLLLVRTDIPWTKKDMEAFDKKLRELYPEWKGIVLMMGTDQAMEKLPTPMAYHLYLRLKAIFEDDFQGKLKMLMELRGESDQLQKLLGSMLQEKGSDGRTEDTDSELET